MTLLTDIISQAKGPFELDYYIIRNPHSNHSTSLDSEKFSNLINDVFSYIDQATQEYDDPLESTKGVDDTYEPPTPRIIELNQNSIDIYVTQPRDQDSGLTELEVNWVNALIGNLPDGTKSLVENIGYQTLELSSSIYVQQVPHEKEENLEQYVISISC